MSFFRIPVMIAITATILGCTQAEITQPPIMVTPNTPSNAVGIDVYAKQRSNGNPVPAFRGQNTVTVRTWAADENGTRNETVGIDCTLDSGVYKAAFTSPANVVVPDYGPSSPALFVRCVRGEMSGSVTSTVVNMTALERNQSAAGTGILGAIVIGVVNEARRDNENDDFGYNPITVQLR